MQKLIIGCLAVHLAVGASMVSAQSSTRPSQAPNGRRGFPQYNAQVRRWTENNMPNLFELMQQQPQYFGEASNHYRIYSTTNEKAKEKLKDTYKSEDAIYGFVLELQRAVDDEKPAIREKIYDATKKLVTNLLDDREAHIKVLQEQINKQEQMLERDRKDIPKLVETRINVHFLREAPTSRPASEPPVDTSPLPGGGTLAWPAEK